MALAYTNKHRLSNCLICGVDLIGTYGPAKYCKTCRRLAVRINQHSRSMILKKPNMGHKGSSAYHMSVDDVLLRLKEQNYKCNLCGEGLMSDTTEISFDHNIPVSRGGEVSFNNIQIVHKQCNYCKYTFTNEELVEWCKKVVKNLGS